MKTCSFTADLSGAKIASTSGSAMSKESVLFCEVFLELPQFGSILNNLQLVAIARLQQKVFPMCTSLMASDFISRDSCHDTSASNGVFIWGPDINDFL